jgi:hypothetical protein
MGHRDQYIRANGKFRELTREEQMKIVDSAGHAGHHRAVKAGYLRIIDSLTALVQTPERVCNYMIDVDHPEEPPMVQCFDQSQFDGRIKMYGRDPAEIARELGIKRPSAS